MNWETLLLPIRLYKFPNKEFLRSPFLRDVDKVTFSSYFRALQDKTQVYPLSKSSYIRTRLTHSMEVGTVGRSLGNLVGKYIINKYNLKNITHYDFGYIIQAAALAHDIGNPPFGHIGEQVICDFYREFINKYKVESDNLSNYNNNSNLTLLDIIYENKQNLRFDNNHYAIYEPMFTMFDGNAQGFRIITKLAGNNQEYGLNLTYPVIATFCKYPNIKKNVNFVGSKKIGIFKSELNIFDNIKDTLKISNYSTDIVARYPLTYLLEAADDICYLTADLCDAIFINIVDFNEIKDIFYNLLFSIEVKDFIKNTNYLNNNYLDNCKKKFDDYSDNYKPLDNILKYKKTTHIVEALSSEVINILIFMAAESFKKNEVSILNGTFNCTLLKDTNVHYYIQNIRDLAESKIYSSQEKAIKEIKGTKAITEVLNEFINIIINTYKNKLTAKNKLLNKFYLNNNLTKENSLQENLQLINDFIVSCTDKNILDVYHIIKGI